MNAPPPQPERKLLYTVYFIYFFCGLTQCFEGVVLPEFKDHFQITYLEQMLIPFAKNLPFLLAVGIGFLIPRIGYNHCLTIGMICYAVGTLLLVPGLRVRQYGVLLAAFFIIGSGFNFQLVAGNPMLSALGPAEGGSSRLNLGNALGAVAQIIAPAMLAFLLPASLARIEDKLPYIMRLFVALGVVLALTALVTLALKGGDGALSAGQPEAARAKPGPAAWARPKVILGFLTIFLVLGAEAVLFSNYRNFLLHPDIAGLTSERSLQLSTLFMAVFAAGRLAASWIQRRARPAANLALNVGLALACLLFIVFAKGTLAVVAATLIAFFVSVFFPTLYALAIEGMGRETPQASGLLTMGFLGCAVLPLAQGWLADRFGLQASYAICFVPYLCALFYALKGRALSAA
jgi:FHS family L-fucose permease-like MFS transporter